MLHQSTLFVRNTLYDREWNEKKPNLSVSKLENILIGQIDQERVDTWKTQDVTVKTWGKRKFKAEEYKKILKILMIKLIIMLWL